MYGYIYITTNNVNGKIYIRQRKGKYDESYLGSGRILKQSLKKYGIENFENHIIEWCKTKEELNEKEIYWISKYNCNAKNGYGYNIAGGGYKNPIEYMTDKQKAQYSKKISEAKSKQAIIVYKNKEYKFNSRTECETWFLKNMDIKVYCWLKGQVPNKYKNDVQLVKTDDKIRWEKKIA
ncbi:MAG: GIY-YIG nuclease family protein [Clostridium butyricum]|nr:GIY-YIG nuclease family protein [Clostridium butyricum]MDU4853578.1 GIY-YIG nuclease family protein [Clostridioides difficile]